jgi:hypothetical protein
MSTNRPPEQPAVFFGRAGIFSAPVNGKSVEIWLWVQAAYAIAEEIVLEGGWRFKKTSNQRLGEQTLRRRPVPLTR